MIKHIGIRREDKNRWERRVPLIPEDVGRLVAAHGLQVTLQPSTLRIFPDSAYEKVGARIAEDLSGCDLVMGVKEMPSAFFRRDGMYMFFSHTIKGQKHNMAMLRKLVDLGCTLLDYERIVDEKGRRLVFFGRYAGLAGMIDTFWALGRRLAAQGIPTPFERVKMAHEYPDLPAVRQAFAGIAADLRQTGIPPALRPLVVGFAGYGNVSKGAQEIFDLLPHRVVKPIDLLSGNTGEASHELIKVVFREEHTVRPADAGTRFDLPTFFAHPERYESAFRPYLDHLTVLVNCIFWSPKGPRLITIEEAQELWGQGRQAKLQVIGDISCDIDGGIQFTLKETQPDNPVYVYDPDRHAITFGVEGHGPVVMAVDNLPCELSAESSQEFSSALMPFLETIGHLDPRAALDDCKIPEPLKRAVLLWHGRFPAEYAFMQEFLGA